MNVSMQDCFNLGWKIGTVVNGIAKRAILKTYQSERRRIAQDLITFDHRFSRLFSGRPAKDAADEAGISMAEFKDAFEKGNMFASGIAVDYGASLLVAKAGSATDQGDGTDVSPLLENGVEKVVGKQDLATNIKMGMRFPSFQVLNQADARPWQFQQFLTSDGRFRIILFAGNILDATQMKRVQRFGSSLDRPNSFLHRFTPAGKKIDSVIEVLTLHSAPRTKVELLDLHDIFHPFDEKKGWDYNKVFVDDVSYHEGHGEAYKNYGVDKERGCVVIARPDQYVGYIGTLEDVSDMDRYFSEILVPQT
jgi:phenol 2-monooxygenase